MKMKIDLADKQLVDYVLEHKKYRNSKVQVGIAEDYRELISAVASVCDVSIALIVNNMLSLLLENEDFVSNLRATAAKKYESKQKRMEQILQSLAL
jgi:hypothetical protein